MRTKIIYEDNYILVCTKPAGLATQTAKVGQKDMVSELKNYIKQTYLGVVHRLDQPVEGLLVFAKTKAAAANLTKQLSKGMLNKQYYAVIYGQAQADAGELSDYLAKDSNKNKARVVSQEDALLYDGKKAVLQYKVAEKISMPKPLSLMDIHIDTGRFHQIRAQMAHAGMSLLGDKKYADSFILDISRELGITSIALCAYKIAFQHPITGKYLQYTIKPEGKAFSYFSMLP